MCSLTFAHVTLPVLAVPTTALACAHRYPGIRLLPPAGALGCWCWYPVESFTLLHQEPSPGVQLYITQERSLRASALLEYRAVTMAGQQALTEEQTRLVQALKADVASIVENNASLKLFCNEHTYVRYLRARSWNLQKAAKMLHATLEWRMEYKPHLIRFDEVKEECVTGKNYVYPATDKKSRPVLLMRPRKENTKTSERQIKYLIYLLEWASGLADKNEVGKMTWLLDFEGYSISNAPPLKVSIQCNNILQNHYPERLGAAVCYHAPTLFSLTWKAVRPFIDPVTQQKIIFVEKGKEADVMDELFYMDKMEQCMGGQVTGYTFDLAKFEEQARAFDQSVEAALQAMETSMRDRSFGKAPQASPSSDGADLEVAVVAQTAGSKGEGATQEQATARPQVLA